MYKSVKCVQIKGEGIWKWREVSRRPKTVFELLQISLWYRLAESGREREGKALAQGAQRFRQPKLQL